MCKTGFYLSLKKNILTVPYQATIIYLLSGLHNFESINILEYVTLPTKQIEIDLGHPFTSYNTLD